MNDSRKNLIDDLVADLKPVAHPGRIGPAATLWLAAALCYSIAMVLVTGPLRPGAVSDLLSNPLFALETLVSFATIAAFAIAALALAVPGLGLPRRVFVWPLALLGAWLAFYFAGLWQPYHPASMLGKRDHCVLQAFFFSLPNLFVLLVIARRFYPVWPRITAAAAGLAGGAIPAALMQFGCMYDPVHILTEHMAPILFCVAVGVMAGPYVLKQRRAVPRSRDVSIH